MFLIQTSQLHAMRAQRMAEFQSRLELHLRQFFPSNEILNRCYWAQHFQLIMQRCTQYQLRSEAAITIFFNAICCLGSNFEAGICGVDLQQALISKYLPEREKTAKLIEAVEKGLQAA